MLYVKSPATDPGRSKSQYQKFLLLATLLMLAMAGSVAAQTNALRSAQIAGLSAAQTSGSSYRKEIETGEKVSLSVKSRNGRVSVIASEEQTKNVIIEASSAGAAVAAPDVHTTGKGGTVEIEVRDRRDADRIDLIVRIPTRAKSKLKRKRAQSIS